MRSTDQLEELFDDSFRSDPIAQAVVALMTDRTAPWRGTTTELLTELRRRRTVWDTGWSPENTVQLAHALTRSAPLLRQHRITFTNVKIGHSSERGKLITKEQPPVA
jgi:hypothetical protein